jgi:hypothetical protein
LVADPEVDAVLVLTNLETHLRYAKLAMEAGKHVLVEKPLCATVAEIESAVGGVPALSADRVRQGLLELLELSLVDCGDQDVAPSSP